MSKTLWCLPSCTLRGETSDTRLLDKIFLLTIEISVGRQRILFLTRVRYKYYNHVDALTNSRKHRWAFESHHSCSPYILILQGTAKKTPCCIEFNSKNTAGSVAISRILCAAFTCDLYGYEVHTKHFLPPTFISYLAQLYMIVYIYYIHAKSQFP